MKNYGLPYSTVEPQEIEVTKNAVFTATNIQSYTHISESGEEQLGYQYNLTEYTKDEYIVLLAQNNAKIEEELQATKILLGVE